MWNLFMSFLLKKKKKKTMGGDFTGKQQNSAKGIYALAGKA